jgi:hypothetical protein
LPPRQDESPARRPVSARHLAIGWWSIFIFGALGLALETMHGLKFPLYLDVSNETRRLMWTLAHAHGTLMGLVHIAFAVSLPALPGLAVHQQSTASKALMGATILLPGGFFLGGIRFYAGDPGIGIVFVPPGAVLLLLVAFLLARATRARAQGAS